jgi:hypothetical protein
MGPIGSPEKSGSNHLTLHNKPEDGRTQLNRSGSLRNRISHSPFSCTYLSKTCLLATINTNEQSDKMYYLTTSAVRMIQRQWQMNKIHVRNRVEWYRQGKADVLRQKPVPLPLCPLKKPTLTNFNSLHFFPVCVVNYISKYKTGRLRTLFPSWYLFFIPLLHSKPLHVSAVLWISHHQVVIKLKNLYTDLF